MTEPKRRDLSPVKPRARGKADGDEFDPNGHDEPPAADHEPEHIGFDEETNSRYEEIKRGSTHISELQQMTIPQLLKTAKDEGLTEYSGLKKQDLIFKILKERV